MISDYALWPLWTAVLQLHHLPSVKMVYVQLQNWASTIPKPVLTKASTPVQCSTRVMRLQSSALWVKGCFASLVISFGRFSLAESSNQVINSSGQRKQKARLPFLPNSTIWFIFNFFNFPVSFQFCQHDTSKMHHKLIFFFYSLKSAFCCLPSHYSSELWHPLCMFFHPTHHIRLLKLRGKKLTWQAFGTKGLENCSNL